MCQLVFLVPPSFKVDKDTLVEVSRNDLDRGSGEFGAQLIEASGRNTLLRTIDVKGRDRGVM